MSAASERDRLNPNHPLYYAPRRSSERPELRPVPSQEATAERTDRPGSSPIAFDSELENAVSEALRNPLDPAVIRKAPEPFNAQPLRAVSKTARHPLDPEIIHEHPGLAQWRTEMLGAVRRFALPVGIAAIVAVLIVIMLPAWRSDSTTRSDSAARSDSTTRSDSAGRSDNAVSSASGVMQPTRTDPPQVIKTEAAPKPALADFQSLLAPSNTSEPVTREQPGRLLEGFVRWRQNSESTEPAGK
jgi:hypothetical protein